MIRGWLIASMLFFTCTLRADEPRVDAFGDPLPAGVAARMGTTRLRHGDSVHLTRFLQDGRWLLSVSGDGTARLWDSRTGQEHRRFTHRPTGQRWVYPKLSPDGKIFVTRTNTFRFWDVASGLELSWSPGKNPTSEPWDDNADTGVRFSADGRIIYLWGGWRERVTESHGVLESWDIATGKRTQRLLLSWGLIPSPDCRTFVVATPETLQLRAVVGNKVLHEWKSKAPQTHWHPQFSPDGKFLTAIEWDAVVTWDLADGKEKYRIRFTAEKSNTPYSGHVPVFSADGKSMIARQQFEPWDLWIWETATGKFHHKVRTGPATWTAMSPDGKHLVTQHMIIPEKDGRSDWQNRTDETKLWEVDTGKLIARLAGVEPSDNVAGFSPDSKTLAIAYRNNPAIATFDIPSGKKRYLVGADNSARGLAFSHDGRSLASFAAWNSPNPVRIWDARTGQERSQAAWPAKKGTFTSQAFWGANDKLQVLVALFDVHRIRVGLQLIDIETSKPIRSFTKKDGQFGACAVSADGRLLAQRVGDQFIIWDMTTGRQMQTMTWKPVDRNTSALPELIFAPNDKSVAVRGVWYTANQQHHPWFAVWELASGKERWRLDDSQLPNFMPTHSTLMIFSPDCKNVLLTGDRGFHLWDLARNKEIRRFGSDFVPTNARAAFSPDGKLLAGMRHDASNSLLAFWDVDTGTALEPLDLAPNKITAFAFSPDGKTLATASSDTTILVWDTSHLLARNKIAPRPVATLWVELAAEDAVVAFKAVAALERQSADALALFKENLKPVAPADPKQVQRLLADLESGSFAVRAKALRELEQLGDLALPALRELHKKPPPLETRRQLDDLIPKIEGPASPDLVRLLRAIEVLEQIGNPDARHVLQTLAQGADQHRATLAARAALRRLQR